MLLPEFEFVGSVESPSECDRNVCLSGREKTNASDERSDLTDEFLQRNFPLANMQSWMVAYDYTGWISMKAKRCQLRIIYIKA